MEKPKILVLGGGNIDMGKAVAALLNHLEHEVIIARPSNVFELTIPDSYNETISIRSFTPERDYGWYRKFEKKGKKRNFKKAN